MTIIEKLRRRVLYCRGDVACEPCASKAEDDASSAADHIAMNIVPDEAEAEAEVETTRRFTITRGVGGKIRISYAASQSTPLKSVGGKLVSARSKSGSPACSQAASDWRTGRADKSTYQQLAQCRAQAATKHAAKLHSIAGNEGHAQHLEHIAASTHVTKKDRMARAGELKAQHAAKGQAAGAGQQGAEAPAAAPTPAQAQPAASPTPAPKSAPSPRPSIEARKARVLGKLESTRTAANKGGEGTPERRQAFRNAGRDVVASGAAKAAESGGGGYFSKLKAIREKQQAAAGGQGASAAPTPTPAPATPATDRFNLTGDRPAPKRVPRDHDAVAEATLAKPQLSPADIARLEHINSKDVSPDTHDAIEEALREHKRISEAGPLPTTAQVSRGLRLPAEKQDRDTRLSGDYNKAEDLADKHRERALSGVKLPKDHKVRADRIGKALAADPQYQAARERMARFDKAGKDVVYRAQGMRRQQRSGAVQQPPESGGGILPRSSANPQKPTPTGAAPAPADAGQPKTSAQAPEKAAAPVPTSAPVASPASPKPAQPATAPAAPKATAADHRKATVDAALEAIKSGKHGGPSDAEHAEMRRLKAEHRAAQDNVTTLERRLSGYVLSPEDRQKVKEQLTAAKHAVTAAGRAKESHEFKVAQGILKASGVAGPEAPKRDMSQSRRAPGGGLRLTDKPPPAPGKMQTLLNKERWSPEDVAYAEKHMDSPVVPEATRNKLREAAGAYREGERNLARHKTDERIKANTRPGRTLDEVKGRIQTAYNVRSGRQNAQHHAELDAKAHNREERPGRGIPEHVKRGTANNFGAYADAREKAQRVRERSRPQGAVPSEKLHEAKAEAESHASADAWHAEQEKKQAEYQARLAAKRTPTAAAPQTPDASLPKTAPTRLPIGGMSHTEVAKQYGLPHDFYEFQGGSYNTKEGQQYTPGSKVAISSKYRTPEFDQAEESMDRASRQGDPVRRRAAEKRMNAELERMVATARGGGKAAGTASAQAAAAQAPAPTKPAPSDVQPTPKSTVVSKEYGLVTHEGDKRLHVDPRNLQGAKKFVGELREKSAESESQPGGRTDKQSSKLARDAKSAADESSQPGGKPGVAPSNPASRVAGIKARQAGFAHAHARGVKHQEFEDRREYNDRFGNRLRTPIGSKEYQSKDDRAKRPETASKLQAIRARFHATPKAQATIAAQETRADQRGRAKLPLFSGQTPDERPHEGTPQSAPATPRTSPVPGLPKQPHEMTNHELQHHHDSNPEFAAAWDKRYAGSPVNPLYHSLYLQEAAHHGAKVPEHLLPGGGKPAGGAAPEAQPPAPATPAPSPAAIPDEVKDHVKQALGSYKERAANIRRGADLARNPTIGGGRRYVDDTRSNKSNSVARDKGDIKDFIAAAKENGVEGKVAVKEIAKEVLPRTKGDPLAGVRSVKPDAKRAQEVIGKVRGRVAANVEAAPASPAAPPKPASAHEEHIAKTTDDLRGTLEKQMDREVNPRRKAMAAESVLHGENPEVQKRLAQHLFDNHPDVYRAIKESPGRKVPFAPHAFHHTLPPKPVPPNPYAKPPEAATKATETASAAPPRPAASESPAPAKPAPTKDQIEWRQQARQGRFQHKTGMTEKEASEYRGSEAAKQKTIRARAQQIQKEEPDRLERTNYPTRDISHKMRELDRPFSYTDKKGDLPSYYASKSRAYRRLATQRIDSERRSEEAKQKEAAATRKSQVKGMVGLHTGKSSVTPQTRYAMHAREATKQNALGFKQKEIGVTVATGKKSERIPVKAHVIGDLAVHRGIGDTNPVSFNGLYKVTHIPTGLAIGDAHSLARAKQIAGAIHARKIDLAHVSKNRKSPESQKHLKYIHSLFKDQG